VHTGFANLDPYGSLSNFAFLCHAQWGIKPEGGTSGRKN
jgi:hypothetical protein